jgi:ribonucleoside-diphosphate reductase alpha chain
MMMQTMQIKEAKSEVNPVLADGLKLGLSENSIRVLMSRYLKKDQDGIAVEKPSEMFWRIAETVARAEANYGATEEKVAEIRQSYIDMMVGGVFLPNSPTIMNAGREMGMLSACFVLPIGDSIDEIFDTVKNTALIQKAGGGTGFSFDRLRPTGSYIKSSGGTTSGPISFWKVLAEATNAIQQGAFRRGANMGMMSMEHCDIIKFIFAKQDTSRFQNYNISVKVTDEWMRQYRKNPDQPNVVVDQRSKKAYVIPKTFSAGTTIENYELKDLILCETYVDLKTKPAVWTMGDIWNTIVQNAWKTGEPGIVFIDRINQFNPTPNVGVMEATNPCGEQPLLPYEACNLGSINLGAFVRHDLDDGHKGVDWDGLRKAVHLSTRFLENVVEVNNYVIPQIAKICTENRKIGLGIMGFADALFKLGVAYNSEDGLAWGEKFMKFVNDEAHNESERLAEERGVFKNWTGSRWELEWKRKQRNACSTTVAPTGTISIIIGCSGGIEPLFSLAFERHVMKDSKGVVQKLVEVNSIFKAVAEVNNYWGYDQKELFDGIAAKASLHDFDRIPEEVRRVFVGAHDIAPEWHVKMQAAFQKHCDSSISKTTNFPQDATPDDVRKIYDLAYEMGCKGVTVYRDKCRDEQPMALKSEPKKDAKPVPAELKPIRTPSVMSSIRLRSKTPFGNMHMTVSIDPKTDRELEVFAQIGKGGDIISADLEATCRMISLWLRAGGSLKYVIEQLDGIGSHLAIGTKDGQVASLGDGLAKSLRKYDTAKTLHGIKAILLGEVDLDKVPVHQEGFAVSKMVDDLRTTMKVKCPSCEVGTLVYEESCKKCYSCGFSKC